MTTNIIKYPFNTLIILLLTMTVSAGCSAKSERDRNVVDERTAEIRTAVFAGGCFWCVESDFEKLDGVITAVSGYTGGEADTADYKTVTYSETGHFEAVEVSYDPNQVTYSELVEFFWRTIDPTDPDGQFCDKGSSYKSAIFYADQDQQTVLNKSLASLEKTKPFSEDIVTEILPATPFYPAEDYHQDYYKKNPIRYRVYRTGCGRDRRLERLWNK